MKTTDTIKDADCGKFQYIVKFATKKQRQIRVVCYNADKIKTVYVDTICNVKSNGQEFIIRMPQCTKTVTIECFDAKNSQDNDFSCTVERQPLLTNIRSLNLNNPLIPRFIDFAQEFAENAGVLSAQKSIYMSNEGDFTYFYYDIIKDKNGKNSTTPAQICTLTNVMNFAKYYMQDMTVTGRFYIQSHEFGHGFLNKDQKSEIEADINSLEIALALGYSRVEAKNVYLKVLLNNPTDSNTERMRVLLDYIENYDKNRHNG